MEVIVNASIGTEKYYTKIVGSKHTVYTDEPISLGGKDKGMNPFELLAASLASCTAATLRMYIARKKWDIPKIEVKVKLNYNKEEAFTNFDRMIYFPQAIMTYSMEEDLIKIANRCPVHKILEGTIGITSIIKKVEQ